MSAPVCPISRGQSPPRSSGRLIPNIPIAIDLPSAIAAVNAAQNILFQPPTNNVFPQQPFGYSDMGGPGYAVIEISNWKQVKRVTQVKRFFNPTDDNIWIDVEFVTYLEFRDKGRKATLIFQDYRGD